MRMQARQCGRGNRQPSPSAQVCPAKERACAAANWRLCHARSSMQGLPVASAARRGRQDCMEPTLTSAPFRSAAVCCGGCEECNGAHWCEGDPAVSSTQGNDARQPAADARRPAGKRGQGRARTTGGTLKSAHGSDARQQLQGGSTFLFNLKSASGQRQQATCIVCGLQQAPNL